MPWCGWTATPGLHEATQVMAMWRDVAHVTADLPMVSAVLENGLAYQQSRPFLLEKNASLTLDC
jgi:hypothetical protein